MTISLCCVCVYSCYHYSHGRYISIGYVSFLITLPKWHLFTNWSSSAAFLLWVRYKHLSLNFYNCFFLSNAMDQCRTSSWSKFVVNQYRQKWLESSKWYKMDFSMENDNCCCNSSQLHKGVRWHGLWLWWFHRTYTFILLVQEFMTHWKYISDTNFLLKFIIFFNLEYNKYWSNIIFLYSIYLKKYI